MTLRSEETEPQTLSYGGDETNERREETKRNDKT